MKQDPKLVAAKQKFEMAYVAKKWKITQKKVREIMAELGNNGKMCRSRSKIEARIKQLQKLVTVMILVLVSCTIGAQTIEAQTTSKVTSTYTRAVIDSAVKAGIAKIVFPSAFFHPDQFDVVGTYPAISVYLKNYDVMYNAAIKPPVSTDVTALTIQLNVALARIAALEAKLLNVKSVL